MNSCEIDKNIDLVDFINQEKLIKKLTQKNFLLFYPVFNVNQ